MKAYLINPDDRTITEIEHDGTLQGIYKACGCDCVDAVYLPNGDTCYVDDEGLIKGPVHQFFGFKGYPQPLAGKGLILGSTQAGNSKSPKNSIDFYKEKLCWIENLFGPKCMGITEHLSEKTVIGSIERIEAFLM